MTEAKHDAEFLAGDGKDKVGMAVRDDPLDRAFTRTDAEPAALDDGLTAHVDLERIAFAGHEAVDAARHMRKDRVGGESRRRRRPRRAR